MNQNKIIVLKDVEKKIQMQGKNKSGGYEGEGLETPRKAPIWGLAGESEAQLAVGVQHSEEKFETSIYTHEPSRMHC